MVAGMGGIYDLDYAEVAVSFSSPQTQVADQWAEGGIALSLVVAVQNSAKQWGLFEQ